MTPEEIIQAYRTQAIRRVAWSAIAITIGTAAALACNKVGSVDSATKSAATGAGTAEGTAIDLHLNKDDERAQVFGTERLHLSGPAFFKRFDGFGGKKFAIAIFNAGATDASCDAFVREEVTNLKLIRLAEPISGDGFAFLVESPDVYDHTSWSLYYRKPGTGERSSSGAGPSTSNVKVKLSTISEDSVTGEISGGLWLVSDSSTLASVKGTFKAKLCPVPQPE